MLSGVLANQPNAPPPVQFPACEFADCAGGGPGAPITATATPTVKTHARPVMSLAFVVVSGPILSPRGASPETAPSATHASRPSAASQIPTLCSPRTARL